MEQPVRWANPGECRFPGLLYRKRGDGVIAGGGRNRSKEDFFFFRMGEITLYLYANGSDSVERGKLVKQYLH